MSQIDKSHAKCRPKHRRQLITFFLYSIRRTVEWLFCSKQGALKLGKKSKEYPESDAAQRILLSSK